MRPGEPFVSGKDKTEILSPALRPGADGSGMFVEPLAADIEVSLGYLDHPRPRRRRRIVRQ
jgi:hypothetical protein